MGHNVVTLYEHAIKYQVQLLFGKYIHDHAKGDVRPQH